MALRTRLTRAAPAPAPPRPRLREAGRRWLIFAAALVVWQYAVRLVPADMRPYFPPPTAIAEHMYRLWLTGPPGHLFLTPVATGQVLPSLGRMAAGWALAVVCGVAAGLALGRSERARDIVEPMTHFFRTLPPPALIPIFIIVFKLTDVMRIAVIAFGVVWPVVMNTIDGARSADPLLIDTARVFGLGRARRLWSLILPSAAPKIFAGLRISLSMALILMVVSETIGGFNGIGYTLFHSEQAFLITDMWAWIALLGILGYGLNAALLVLERRLLAWHRAAHDEQGT